MATTKEQIRSWLNEAKARGATHMIVVCDTFDHEDYPVYVMPEENVRVRAGQLGWNNGSGLPTRENDQMSRVMEVYSLALPIEDQLNEHRAFHFD